MTKVAVITGAGSGIGAATVRKFLDDGYSVALLGRRLEALEETANGHPSALCLSCDVGDPDAVEASFAQIVEKFGRIDVLFNNAGMGTASRTIDETPVEDWLAVVRVNLTGMFLCARASFAQMRKQEPQGGRIINNGSISSDVPRPGSVPYTTTKHGVTGLTRTLSLDGRPFSIACGQIDIGNALTPLAAKMAKGVPQADGSIQTEPLIDVNLIAKSVLQMADLPLDANVQFMTIMATNMPYIGRG